MQIKVEKGKDKLIYYWHTRQPQGIESWTHAKADNHQYSEWYRHTMDQMKLSQRCVLDSVQWVYLFLFIFVQDGRRTGEWVGGRTDRPVVFLAIWLLPLQIFRNRSFVHSTFLNNEAEKVASTTTPKQTRVLKFKKLYLRWRYFAPLIK